jgi:branched-chain amino acid transport system permease protein
MLLMNLTDITNGSQASSRSISRLSWAELQQRQVLLLFHFCPGRFIALPPQPGDQFAHRAAWLAMREDEDVAQMSGIDTSKYKILAFAIGAFIGGLGGAIFASWQGSIFPDNFNMNVSINILCVIILGGLGNQLGVILGAMALIALPDILRGFSDYRMIIFGLLLIIMMILRPQGFLPRKAPKFEENSSGLPDTKKEVQS